MYNPGSFRSYGGQGSAQKRQLKEQNTFNGQLPLQASDRQSVCGRQR